MTAEFKKWWESLPQHNWSPDCREITPGCWVHDSAAMHMWSMRDAEVAKLREALERMIDVGMEFYDMECGENGSEAIAQARAALDGAKEEA